MRLTPSDTTRSASTSRPESVSSRIANLGLRSSICRISWRFFSPPEKPSFTERSANAGSMRRLSIAERTSLTQVRSGGASPSIAVLAVRRKFDTETPGTSTGYCMARNRPARARSSTDIASTSAPSSVTEPRVTVYFGCPAMEYASVDLPDPLGPMIAWVSPSLMVRSTPLRISLVPVPSVPVSTVTCRSRISSVAIGVFLFSQLLWVERSVWVWRSVGGRAERSLDVDEHVVAGHLDRVDRHRLGRRWAAGLARPQVEAGAVQPALDLAALDVPLRQRDRGVRALVVDGVPVVAVTDHGDRCALDVHGDGGPGGDVGDAADTLVGHSGSPGGAERSEHRPGVITGSSPA